MNPDSLYINERGAFAIAKTLHVKNDPTGWFDFKQEKQIKLSELDVILMRQDPPFNSNYIYNTYVLESAEKEGVLVVNKPLASEIVMKKFLLQSFLNVVRHFW